jgi:hypothetical protein
MLGAFVQGASAARVHISGGSPVSVHRLGGDVYEYYYVVSTGSGPYDRVGVHRVVAVGRGRPIAARDGVFFVHGDSWSFDTSFRLGNTASRSMAVFLASKGIDVWGVDLGYTLVPAGTTDFSFMRGWGLQRDVNDVEKALTFARSVRSRTGSSHSKLTLLAYSRGGWIGYALLNQEAHKPLAQRQVRAFIPVETLIETNDSSIVTRACLFASYGNTQIATGVYDYSDQAAIDLGRLALTAPDQPPPVNILLETGTLGAKTNQQAADTLGAAPFLASTLLVPYFHSVAGVFPDGDFHQLPTGLVYTDAPVFDDALATMSPFEPVALVRDTSAITCSPGQASSFDNHLKDVTVPVLYVGAGGGFGRAGLYSLKLLGSRNVRTHIVSFYPANQAAQDFGHGDLFTSRRARQLVWTPIYHWLARHAK